MAIDPERVGLQNIEVPQVCDFGDNELDYMTRRGRVVDNNVDVLNDCADDDDNHDDDDDNHDDDDDDDDDDDANIDNDDDDVQSISSSSSEDSIASTKSDSNNCQAALPTKFIAFLKS